MLLRSDGAAVACGENQYGQTDVEPPPAGLQYTTSPELHLLWLRLTWIVRKGGDAGLARAAGALTARGLRASVFRFLLAREAS